MLKRIGLLAFVLAAGTFLKPTVASAQERYERDNGRFVEAHRDGRRFDRDYGRDREYFEHRNDWRRDDWRRDDYRRGDRFVREDSDGFIVQYRGRGYEGWRDCR